MIYNIEITNEAAKAIEAHIDNVHDWLQNLIDNKASKCINRLVEIVTDKQAKRLFLEDKEKIISNISVEAYSAKRQGKKLQERISYKEADASTFMKSKG